MIRHIVALRFQEGVEEDVKEGLFETLNKLREHLDGVLDFQVRKNVSPEDNVVRGFRDVFWFDFADDMARDNYLVDQAHQTVAARLVGLTDGGVDGVMVLDLEI